jgi:hypothetical protein
MSKFSDLLKSINKTAVPALGFRMVAGDALKSPVLMVIDLTQSAGKKVKELVASGVAAAFINSSAGVSSFKQLAESLGDIPLGLDMESGSDLNIDEYIAAGCDFILFNSAAPLSLVNNEKPGKMLKIDPSLAPVLARAVSDLSLPIDGILLGGEVTPVTVERILSCHFFADATGKPLAVKVDAALSKEEMQALHEAGVKVIIVSGKITRKTINDLSKMINSLPKISKKKSSGVILPRISAGMQAEPEEEEEEEEEEDI